MTETASSCSGRDPSCGTRISRPGDGWTRLERLDETRERLDETRERLDETRERLDELRASLEQLHATTNMVARRSHRASRMRVLFLVHYMEAWDSIADVVELMLAADDFEPIVASLPRRLPGSSDFSHEDVTHARLTALEIPHIRLDGTSLAADAVKQLDPDLIFRQSQWDRDIPPAFSATSLRFSRLALVPYEMCNLLENPPSGPAINDSATDSIFHRSSWAVFCANDFVKARAAEHSPSTGARQFVVTGHPKYDRLRQSIANAPIPTDRPYTILWSAHHSIGDNWSRFGLFPVMAPEMIEWATSRPGWRFVFSPHPSLLTVMAGRRPPLTPAAVEEFWRLWADLPNTEVFTGGETGTYGTLLANSDVCVTDGLSMLVEYQIANKPLIHVAREGHRPFNEIGDIARRGFHTVTSTEEARELIDDFAMGVPDPLEERQFQVMDELFGGHDAAREIVDFIRNEWDAR